MRNSPGATACSPNPAGVPPRWAVRIPVCPAAAPRPRTVLLVDPHADSLEIYGAILRHHGFRVLEAATGTEGARMALEHLPDLVVTELRLPGLDGGSLLRRIRSVPALAHTPVIAVTAAAQTPRAEALASGFAELLPKPCAPLRVLAEVQRLSGAAPARIP